MAAPDFNADACNSQVLGNANPDFTFQCKMIYNPIPMEGTQILNETKSSYKDCLATCGENCVAVSSDFKNCVQILTTNGFNSYVGNGSWSAYKSNGKNLLPAAPADGGNYAALSSVTASPSASSSTGALPTETATESSSANSSSSTGAGIASITATSSTATSVGSSSDSTSAGAVSTTTATSGNSTVDGPQPDNGGGGGIDAGTVAGAAVGAAVGAALIAFLITFFLCRRRRPRSTSSAALLGNEKAASPTHPWEAFLPQSADDGKMAHAVSTLYAQIDQHVENYYSSSFQPDLFEQSRGYLSMVDSGRLPLGGSLEQIMPGVATPQPIIKHCFAWVILNKLSPAKSADETLLPPEFARSPPRFDTARTRGEEKAASQAYNYWRVMTAYLMYPNAASGLASGDQQISPSASQTIDVLTTAFAPWAKTSKNGQDHLRSVLKSASDTGLLVLSQSSSFIFEWNSPRKEDARAVMTSPAFVKTADEHGETLAERHVLVKSKVEGI